MKVSVKSMREQLVNFVQQAEADKVKALYELLGSAVDPLEERKRLIRLEREKYLQGASKTFSPESIKAMALKKKKRYAI